MWNQWPARKLVEIDLNGRLFYLDLRMWECRDVNDFSNRFSLHEVEHHHDYTRLCFDPKTNNVFRGNATAYELRKEELLHLQLPPIRELDPVGYRALNGLSQSSHVEFSASLRKDPAKAILLPKKRISKLKGKHL